MIISPNLIQYCDFTLLLTNYVDFFCSISNSFKFQKLCIHDLKTGETQKINITVTYSVTLRFLLSLTVGEPCKQIQNDTYGID